MHCSACLLTTDRLQMRHLQAEDALQRCADPVAPVLGEPLKEPPCTTARPTRTCAAAYMHSRLETEYALQRGADPVAPVLQLLPRAAVQRQQRQAAPAVRQRAGQVLEPGVEQQPGAGVGWGKGPWGLEWHVRMVAPGDNFWSPGWNSSLGRGVGGKGP